MTEKQAAKQAKKEFAAQQKAANAATTNTVETNVNDLKNNETSPEEEEQFKAQQLPTTPETKPEENNDGEKLPTVAGPLEIVMNKEVKTVEFNGNVAQSEEDKVAFIRMYIRNKVLRQFNVVEVEKNLISGGKIYLNSNRSALKLPRVKETPSGAFAESLEQYYTRVKPDIKKWLTQAFQTSTITMEMVGNIG